MSATCRYKLFFITGNRHKVEEARKAIEGTGVCLEQVAGYKRELQLDDLAEIALVSALEAYTILKHPLVVEDAGLFIEALNGFPGPYSSYVYKTIGVKGILRLMDGVDNRNAYFASAVAIINPPYIGVVVEKTEGMIASRPRGGNGFGFDPIFMPRGMAKTFAEMSTDEKNMYSHRAKAFRVAVQRMLSIIDGGGE